MAECAKPARVPEAFRELRWKDGPPPVLLQPVVPLQIGIYDLFAVRLADDVDPADLRAALKWHCSTTGYLQSLARHDSRRHDPDGRAVEKIGDDVRLSVKLRLQDRFARRHVRREKVTSVIEAHRAAAKAGGDDGPGADGALGRPPVRLDVGVAPRPTPRAARAPRGAAVVVERRQINTPPRMCAAAAERVAAAAAQHYPQHRWSKPRPPTLGQQIAEDMSGMGARWVRGR